MSREKKIKQIRNGGSCSPSQESSRSQLATEHVDRESLGCPAPHILLSGIITLWGSMI